MRYTLIYDPAALNDPADIWALAPDRQAVTDAADDIEWLLKRSPETRGRPYNGNRVLQVKPLEVVFEVSPDDRRVRLLEFTFVG